MFVADEPARNLPPVLTENPPYRVAGNASLIGPTRMVRKCGECWWQQEGIRVGSVRLVLEGPHFCLRDGVPTLVYWVP